MASLNLSLLRPIIGPYIDYASEEVIVETEQHDIIYPSSSMNGTTRWYSFPDEPSAWLSDCLKWHDDCEYWTNQASQTGFLPERLVDVGSLESKSTSRLVATKENPLDDQRYLALSHRWPERGDPVLDHIQTKTDTLPSKLEGIDEEKLSQTLRFAFDACRWLKIRHLWVDTLCIIQVFLADTNVLWYLVVSN